MNIGYVLEDSGISDKVIAAVNEIWGKPSAVLTVVKPGDTATEAMAVQKPGDKLYPTAIVEKLVTEGILTWGEQQKLLPILEGENKKR